MAERKRIYLCLAHMSEEGIEQKYIKEAFDTNWVVPLGPNVNGFEKDLEEFLASPQPSPEGKGVLNQSYTEGKGVRTADPMCYKLLKENAERMRKNPTEAEGILWNALKANATGLHFRRQHIIQDYIVDFFCYDKMLTIELDGGYHDKAEQKEQDLYRSSELKRLGYTEIRFRNEEVIDDIDAVVAKIKQIASKLPSLQGGDRGRLSRVVALSSGTAAIHLALIGCGVGPGDEVIVQSFTFCASSHPVTYLGATPVFVDSERETWNIDPELLEFAIKDRIAKTGKKPKAIIPVALYGMPYRIDEIMAIADRYEIPVIEDAAEGFGSKFKGQMLGTFGRYGALSFNGNKMITTSGGGALICSPTSEQDGWGGADTIMWYATQARESYPYYQHEKIGYNYRMSNICAGIGRGQMTVANKHIEHHKHVQALYEELLADVKGVTVHSQPNSNLNPNDDVDVNRKFDSNYWLCTITLAPELRIKGQENAYKSVIKSAVGGAAGVIHEAETATTDCQPNDNVEALRVYLDQAGIEARPVWKPMHCQPVYRQGVVKMENISTKDEDIVCQTSDSSVAYINGISEDIFKIGMCLPAGPYVLDDDVRHIVEKIREAIVV